MTKLSWKGIEAELRTDVATSSFGQPVLLYNKRQYGPDDTVELPDGQWILASEYALYCTLTGTCENVALARKFIAIGKRGSVE